jgi:hypothetical protein
MGTITLITSPKRADSELRSLLSDFIVPPINMLLAESKSNRGVKCIRGGPKATPDGLVIY